jgi:hypothetical protein
LSSSYIDNLITYPSSTTSLRTSFSDTTSSSIESLTETTLNADSTSKNITSSTSKSSVLNKNPKLINSNNDEEFDEDDDKSSVSSAYSLNKIEIEAKFKSNDKNNFSNLINILGKLSNQNETVNNSSIFELKSNKPTNLTEPDGKMVQSDKYKNNKNLKQVPQTTVNIIGREPRNNPISSHSNTNRASSLIQNQNRDNENRRANYSLSPNAKNDSYLSVIAQQPKQNRAQVLNPTHNVSFSPSRPSDEGFFAQVIGQGATSSKHRLNESKTRPTSGHRVIEIRAEPQSNQNKRLRSPSNGASRCRNMSSSSVYTERDFNGLLNLANKLSMKNRANHRIQVSNMPRSFSVNYLYNKRQGDLRRCQNKNYKIQIDFNHVGFTTEDIDDIYMPSKLDLFERKLKASVDLSDNSEQEETKIRRKMFHNRPSRMSSNKRAKHDCGHYHQHNPSRIIINYQKNPESYHNCSLAQRQRSYLEEAKRKLNEMRNSKSYFHNLNNKLKSSVTNVVKASQDLARSSEIRQKCLGRKLSLHEIYDIRRDEIRSNQFNCINNQANSNIQNSYTCDDIDEVYMPWMIENYGRKLAIEALKRRGNMAAESRVPTMPRQRFQVQSQILRNRNSFKKSDPSNPYVSQYYAQTVDNSGVNRNDLWLIDKDIRRFVRKSNKNDQNNNMSDSLVYMDTDVSITDSETSSEDTRPTVPDKLKRPDMSLKNKILKTINKSLLSSELTGIDVNMLKLNDNVRKTLRRVEKKALERDLELDLIRSFSCGHLADLRKEDMKYTNLRGDRKRAIPNSYSTEDIQDIYMPRVLENYKLKLAIDKEAKGRGYEAVSSASYQSPNRSGQSPVRDRNPVEYYLKTHVEGDHALVLNRTLITSPPPIQIKSPTRTKSLNSSNLTSPLSPSYKKNPNNLFSQIIQEKLSEVDHKMAHEISITTKNSSRNHFVKKAIKESINEVNESEEEESSSNEGASTDRDQDDSLEVSSSESDDLNMNEDDLKHFETGNAYHSTCSRKLTKKPAKVKTSKSLNLRNPGELISEFYISNMNYAMRYSVEYIQQVAKDMRRRKHQTDSSTFVGLESAAVKEAKLNRSLSVDRLYAVRREHIRYSNEADEYFDSKNISFTTDDIQDIYMPSAIDNYKRKIAVELERRRRFAENESQIYSPCNREDRFPPIRANECQQAPVVLDDFDLFIMNKTKTSIEREGSILTHHVIKAYQPTILVSPKGTEIHSKLTVRSATEQDDEFNVKKPSYVCHQSSFNFVQVKKPPLTYKHDDEEESDPMDVVPETALIRREPSFETFALVNKVQTLFNNEMQEIISSSSPEDSSISSTVESSSDTLSNINMDNFELKNKKHLIGPTIMEDESIDVDQADAVVVPHPHLGTISINNIVTIENADEQIVPNSFTYSISAQQTVIEQHKPKRRADEQVNLEQADLRLEPGYADLRNPVLISHPPRIIDQMIVDSDDEEEEKITHTIIRTETDFYDVPHIQIEQVDPKKYESKPLAKASVNVVRPLSLANQISQDQKYSLSSYIPPESSIKHDPSYKTVQSDLALEEVELSTSVNLLNAPKVKEEITIIQEAKLIPPTSRVPINQPEYLIEEYAHKPLSSSVTYTYENVKDLPSRLHESEYIEIRHQTPSGELKLNYKLSEKPTTLNAPKLNEDIVYAPPPKQFQTELHEHKANLSRQYSALIEPAHILEPVNVRQANLVEYEEQELVEFEAEVQDSEIKIAPKKYEQPKDMNIAHQTQFKEINMATSNEFELNKTDPFVAKLVDRENVKEIKHPNEIENPPEWIQRKVYNLAQVDLNVEESNFAHPFEARNETESAEQINPVENIQTLQLEARSIVAAVLNLAKQETLKTSENKTNEMESPAVSPSVATQKNEETYLNLKPTVFEIATLNRPLDQISNIETFTTEFLESRTDELPLAAPVEPTRHQSELVEPALVRKPVLLNKAHLTESIVDPQTVQRIQTPSYENEEEVAQITKQLNEINQEGLLVDQARPLYLGNFEMETNEVGKAFEYETEADQAQIANVKKEFTVESVVNRASPVELLNAPVPPQEADEFLESVKPMDTIEIDFEEQINITTLQSSDSDEHIPRVCIETVQSYNRGTMEKTSMIVEDCGEFIQHEVPKVEVAIREHTSELIPTGVRSGYVEKIAIGKYFYLNFFFRIYFINF